MKILNNKQVRQLKQLAHNQKAIITIGKRGLTESVFIAIEQTLIHHELIKIKLPAIDKKMRQILLSHIITKNNAQIVQLIGRIAVLYKTAKKPIIQLVE